MLSFKMFTMDAIINSLQSILCDQASSLECLIKDKLTESMNLRNQLSKSRDEIKGHEARIDHLEKREKVFLRLIYEDRCDIESLKLKLNYNRDCEEEIQREIQEAVTRVQTQEKHHSQTANDENSSIGVWNSEYGSYKEDQDHMSNIAPANDNRNVTLTPTSSETVVDESVMIIEPEEEENVIHDDKVHCDASKEAVEEEYDQTRELGSNSLLEHLEEILYSDAEESDKTAPDVIDNHEEGEKKDDTSHQGNLSTSLPDLDPSDVSRVLEADLSNNTNQYIESLLQDDTDSLPDTSLIESDDVDVFKLLQENSNDTFDTPIEVSSECEFKIDDEKKRRRSPIRERWETRKSPRITLLGKETIENTERERSTTFSRKIVSAKKKMMKAKIKKSQCGQCDRCIREDCGECKYCEDKPKFGGPSKLRQKCIERRCEDMSLYN